MRSMHDAPALLQPPQPPSRPHLRAMTSYTAESEDVPARLPVVPARKSISSSAAAVATRGPDAVLVPAAADTTFQGGVAGLPGVEEFHIAQAFREIDHEGHGFVGVSELRYLLTVMGERPTDEELDEMIRMVDSEGNGKISYEDFMELFAPGHAVLLEMTGFAPEQEQQEDEMMAAKSSKGLRQGESTTEQKVMMQGAMDAIGHAFNKSRQSKMEAAFDARRGQSRATPPPPMPASRRQARTERAMLEAQAKAQGKTKADFHGYRRQQEGSNQNLATLFKKSTSVAPKAQGASGVGRRMSNYNDGPAFGAVPSFGGGTVERRHSMLPSAMGVERGAAGRKLDASQIGSHD
mmetsp:Transcript_138890/g.443461  ORF Transcript_138890/g.443461 Transcript_138890/m.443461 type:complete len:350 (-) Transcript_138890:75-1124(-)